MCPKKPTILCLEFFSVVLIALLFYSCDKTVDPLPKPSPREFYDVSYYIELTGSYDNLILTYNKTGSVIETVSPTSFPWEQNFSNFVAGDTVCFSFNFDRQPNKAVGWSYAVSVNKDGNYIAGKSADQDLIPGESAINIHVEWLKVIGS